MWTEALVWASEVLVAQVVSQRELGGGLTSTMLALTDSGGGHSVLRLMDREPWQAHGQGLTARERRTQQALAATPVPAPTSLGLDAGGERTGVPAHLMTWLPGSPTTEADDATLAAMVEMLATIHDVVPAEPFRDYQSWAPSKLVVPEWSAHPESWLRAFDVLAEGTPDYEPTFLHRDHSHRNLLWEDGRISGVVDWVETSTGPAWLDAGHAATNLAVSFGAEPARSYVARYASVTGRAVEPYWLVLDAVGFLPPPGEPPLFRSQAELRRLDGWLHELLTQPPRW